MVGLRIDVFLLGPGHLVRKNFRHLNLKTLKFVIPQKDELRISATSASGTTFYWLEGARAQNAGSLPLCQGTLVKELFSLAGTHHVFCSVKIVLWKSVCKVYREQ